MGKYFGTDGIRGIANKELDINLAFKIGQAAAQVLTEYEHHKPCFYIGKDTRISSDVLESALIAGICSCGADVHLLGVIPTPAVAYLTVKNKADAGIVISASHNSFEHNGIKIFSSQGYKLNDELEERIENVIDNGVSMELPTGEKLGRVIRNEGTAADEYVKHLCETVDTDLTGMKIAVDCANGASSATCRKLFESLGVKADIFYDKPNGININDACGSTCIETLQSIVKHGDYDAGLAFDGDADRCIAVDENGEVLNGDVIMALCGVQLQKEGKLSGDTIVATVLSNLGLIKFAEENAINVQTSAVGDRFVLEKMIEGGYKLGGEQSGHIIFGDMATTGDGELTGVQFLCMLRKAGTSCSSLASKVPAYPQAMINCYVPNDMKKQIVNVDSVAEAIREEELAFGSDGRILVRPSGTEALVRVMAEGKEKDAVLLAAKNVADAIYTYVKQNCR